MHKFLSCTSQSKNEKKKTKCSREVKSTEPSQMSSSSDCILHVMETAVCIIRLCEQIEVTTTWVIPITRTHARAHTDLQAPGVISPSWFDFIDGHICSVTPRTERSYDVESGETVTLSEMALTLSWDTKFHPVDLRLVSKFHPLVGLISVQ